LATGISWLVTFSAVCVGYIFFRANDMTQAFTMLKTIASPRQYGYRTLPLSLYVLVFVAVAGYFVVIGATMALDYLGDIAEVLGGRHSRRFAAVIAAASNERWVWVAPIVMVLAIYLSVIFHPGHADTGPVIYTLF